MDISRTGKEIWKQVDPRKLGYDVSVRPSDPPYRLWVGGMRQESSLRGKEFVPTSTFLPDPECRDANARCYLRCKLEQKKTKKREKV